MNKDKCDCQGLMMAALAIGAGLGVIAGMAIYAAAYPVFQSEKWAAWVQAVGSLGAIFSAVALYAVGQKARARSAFVAHQKHAEGVMRAVECFALTLVETMVTGKYYDNHKKYGKPEFMHEGEIVKAEQFRAELNGVHSIFFDFCLERAALLESCSNSLRSIDWSTAPISAIGVHIISIAGNCQTLADCLRKEASESSPSLRRKMVSTARFANKSILNSIDTLQKEYGYISYWPYKDKEPALINPWDPALN